MEGKGSEGKGREKEEAREDALMWGKTSLEKKKIRIFFIFSIDGKDFIFCITGKKSIKGKLLSVCVCVCVCVCVIKKNFLPLPFFFFLSYHSLLFHSSFPFHSYLYLCLLSSYSSFPLPHPFSIKTLPPFPPHHMSHYRLESIQFRLG